MKKSLTILSFFIFVITVSGQDFDTYFQDTTLRVDYLFSGNVKQQKISLDCLSSIPCWAGRRHNLDALPLEGNGQITMRDIATEEIIYRMSFSSLFQEWLTTDEAKRLSKGFENTFTLPYPRRTAEICVTLTDNRGKIAASLTHLIDPADILIEKKQKSPSHPFKYLLKNGSYKDCIDIAILAEGYTAAETELFYKDAQIACDNLFSHEPFSKMKKRFNVIAVASASDNSGVSTPRHNDWRNTVFGSHFDTFYSPRYLTTKNVKTVHDILTGIPYEHIIILANTDVYGGGGIYNAFTLTSTHHDQFGPVIVHEFGHSFGGLADEYFYENDIFSESYPNDTEPWEQNITTLVDFGSKWKDMLAPGTPIPGKYTPKNGDCRTLGIYEGAGYSAKGVYRSTPDCRMKSNEAREFCPVCRRALERLILFYTE